MPTVAIREAEIRDVFATFPSIFAKTVGLDYEFSLVAREKELPSGRLDLLYLGRNELYLVELKVEGFKPAFVTQVVGYRTDLLRLQSQNTLVSGRINALLLVTGFAPDSAHMADAEGVWVVYYDPELILRAYYDQVATLTDFLAVKPKDYGIWHIHLLNRVLYHLPEDNEVASLSQVLKLSRNTIRNQLKLAERLGLADKLGSRYLLTDLGRKYVESKDPSLGEFVLSDDQTNLLRQYVASQPFASETVFGIFALVEAVFTLARNSYPVHRQDLIPYYRDSVGKRAEWQTERAAFLGARAFANYATELGLIAQIGDKFLLTPAGFRFILMLQLHKGIQLIDALEVAVRG